MKINNIKILLFLVIFCNKVFSQNLKNDTSENFGRLIFEAVKREDNAQVLKYSIFEKENMDKYLSNWLTDPFFEKKGNTTDYVKKVMNDLPMLQKAFIAKFERFVQDGRVKGIDWNKTSFLSVVDNNGVPVNTSNTTSRYYRDFDIHVQFKDIRTNKIFQFKIDDINNTKNGMIITDGLYWNN
ncbi:hypothetical protein [Runella sp.]|jgi:hypothetical protein|uniref:hypothetical protein n=1 Tax=Runella sp. TaxID=1960881 RepID=UPI00261CCC1B|nr:hypothetical protein [Runella sp.]